MALPTYQNLLVCWILTETLVWNLAWALAKQQALVCSGNSLYRPLLSKPIRDPRPQGPANMGFVHEGSTLSPKT